MLSHWDSSARPVRDVRERLASAKKAASSCQTAFFGIAPPGLSSVAQAVRGAILSLLNGGRRPSRYISHPFGAHHRIGVIGGKLVGVLISGRPAR